MLLAVNVNLMKQPLISILITCYNYGQYLMKAVDSAVNQSYKNIEIVIVNDGSTDEYTNTLCRNIAQKNIKVIWQENMGLPGTRDVGIRQAKGEFILPLDADNILDPQFLEKTYTYLLNKPQIGFVYTWMQCFGETDEIRRHPDFDFKTLLDANYVDVCSLFRKRDWEKVAGFGKSNWINPFDDWHFFLKICELGLSGYCVKEPLLHYRVHLDSISHKAFLDYRMLLLTLDKIYELHKKSYMQFDKDKNEFIERNYNNFQDHTLNLLNKLNTADKPLISIIAPVYNAKPAWLQSCIRSVLNQTYTHWELYLCDDGSTNQDTLTELKKWVGHDRRIKIKFNGVHQGIAAVSNISISMAQGDYVTFLDNDYELSPNALFMVSQAILLNPNVKLIYSYKDKVGESGNFEHPVFKPDSGPDILLPCQYFNHLTVISKSLSDSLNWFKSDFPGTQGYDLILRCLDKIEDKEIFHIPKVLYHRRLHLNSV